MIPFQTMCKSTQNKFKKIFVGGLPPQTSENDMREYFSKYGDVMDVVAMRDKTGNKSRGFGFVVFKEAESVDKCQAERPHSLLGKVVDTKRAMPKEESINPDIHCNSKRIFIGGIRKFFTEDDLRNYFSNFGEIVDCTIKRDNISGISRGFAFITFTDRDIVDKVILCKPHSIRQCIVDVKKALSPEELRQIDQENHIINNNHSDFDLNADFHRLHINYDTEDDNIVGSKDMNGSCHDDSKKYNGSNSYLNKRSASYPPNDNGYNTVLNTSNPISPAATNYLLMSSPDPTAYYYDNSNAHNHNVSSASSHNHNGGTSNPTSPTGAPLIWMSVQQCPNGLLLTPVATTSGDTTSPGSGGHNNYFFHPPYVTTTGPAAYFPSTVAPQHLIQQQLLAAAVAASQYNVVVSPQHSYTTCTSTTNNNNNAGSAHHTININNGNGESNNKMIHHSASISTPESSSSCIEEDDEYHDEQLAPKPLSNDNATCTTTSTDKTTSAEPTTA